MGIQRIKFLVLLPLGFSLVGCQGVQFPTIQQMLVNLSYSIPPVWQMVTGLAYLFGMAFIMRGVYQLKVYGESRTMMSSQANLKLPLTLLVVGAALLYYPTTKSVILASTFGYGEQLPLSYPTSNSLWSAQSTQVILEFIQLIGLISFIRGWVYLVQATNQSGQHTFGKAWTHIIGGILAINIEGTTQILEGTFGIT